jgi:hypothetical protein
MSDTASSPTEPKTLAWIPKTPDGWAEKVEAWRWQPHSFPNGKLWYWKKDGDCPRCNHYVYLEKRSGWDAKMTLRQAAAAGDVKGGEVRFPCNCKEPHDGRPANREGCGPEAYVKGPLPADASKAITGTTEVENE